MLLQHSKYWERQALCWSWFATDCGALKNIEISQQLLFSIMFDVWYLQQKIILKTL